MEMLKRKKTLSVLSLESNSTIQRTKQRNRSTGGPGKVFSRQCSAESLSFMFSEYLEAPIVIDCGTSSLKVGFASDLEEEEAVPRFEIPSLIARSKPVGGSSNPKVTYW